ncbi:beta-lactamase [Fusarium coicis]|nr:beta-lactamase [Fusarium coicis]
MPRAHSVSSADKTGDLDEEVRRLRRDLDALAKGDGLSGLRSVGQRDSLAQVGREGIAVPYTAFSDAIPDLQPIDCFNASSCVPSFCAGVQEIPDIPEFVLRDTFGAAHLWASPSSIACKIEAIRKANFAGPATADCLGTHGSNIFMLTLPAPNDLRRQLDGCLSEFENYSPFLHHDQLKKRIALALRAVSYNEHQTTVYVTGQYCTILAILCELLSAAEATMKRSGCSHGQAPTALHWSFQAKKLMEEFTDEIGDSVGSVVYNVLAAGNYMVAERLRHASEHITQALKGALDIGLNDQRRWKPQEEDYVSHWGLFWVLNFFEKRLHYRCGMPSLLHPEMVAVDDCAPSDGELEVRVARFDLIRGMVSYSQLWMNIWSEFLTPKTSLAKKWTDVLIADAKIQIAYKSLPEALLWDTECVQGYVDKGYPEANILRRLQVFLWYTSLRMIVQQSPVSPSSRDAERRQACISTCNGMVEAIATYLEHFTCPRPLDYLATCVLVDCVFHLKKEQSSYLVDEESKVPDILGHISRVLLAMRESACAQHVLGVLRCVLFSSGDLEHSLSAPFTDSAPQSPPTIHEVLHYRGQIRISCLCTAIPKLDTMQPVEIMSRFRDVFAEAALGGKDRKIPGAVLLAADRSGHIIYHDAKGETSVDSSNARTMTADSIFWLASCTKLMTTIAVMQCVEKGLFTLDEDISRIIPELKSPTIVIGIDEANNEPRMQKATQSVTMRHLLTHQSGLGYSFLSTELQAWESWTKVDKEATNGTIEADHLDLFVPLKKEEYALPLLFEPGTSWAYGCGMDWAGQAVERVNGGMRLSEYMKAHIWEPLGIKAMSFRPNESLEIKDRLCSLTARAPSGELVAAPRLWKLDLTDDYGGGGAYGSPSDYLKVLIALLQNQGTILKPDTLAKDVSPATMFRSGVEATAWNYGLGGILNMADVPGVCSKGTMTWSGLPNLFWYSHPTSVAEGVNFCNVTVTYTHPGHNDTVHVETWLPIDNFNGRLQSIGGGGWVAGRYPPGYAAMSGEISEGYATSATDAGLQLQMDYGPDIWALISEGNPKLSLLHNFAAVSLGDQANIARGLIESFYGKAPKYSYWSGCFQGGRQGMMLAQRYPEAYDGIHGCAPAIN